MSDTARSMTERRLTAMALLGLLHEQAVEREKAARLNVCDALLVLSERCGRMFDELSEGRVPENGVADLNEAIANLNQQLETFSRVLR
mgnify:CR=1 FL=1